MSPLTMRAEIGRSAGDASSPQGAATSRTSRVVLAACIQESAHGMSILGQLCDGPLQHAANRSMEPADLVRTDSVAGVSWMNPRLPEDLIRIDVANSGDEVLTEQQPLDRAPSACQEFTPSGERESTLERFDAKPLEWPKVLLGLHHIHVAKTPLVYEP